MSAQIKFLLSALLLVFLTACGGGGGSSEVPVQQPAPQQGIPPNDSDAGSDDPATPVGSENPPPSSDGSAPPPGDSSGGGDAPGTPDTLVPGDVPGSEVPDGPDVPSGDGGVIPPASGGSSGDNGGTPPVTSPDTFAAAVTQAPADGATIRGTVRLLVEGSGIQNVELLPGTGYAPLIARGVVTGDNVGAYIDFDTTVVDDGEISLRIAAFSEPPGEGGREITAMPARSWIVDNVADGTDGPTGGDAADQAFAASLAAAPADGETLSGVVTLEVRGSGMRNVELLPEGRYVPRLGSFEVSEDGTSARLDFDTSIVPNGGVRLRISAFDVPPGASGASEVIAMPARSWLVWNDAAPEGTPEGRAAACLRAEREHTGLDEPEPVVCIQWTPPSPPIPAEQCTQGFDTIYSNPGDGLPVLRDGNRISKLYCEPAAHGGRVNPGCVCMG